ncbi:MAG: hypothetical protein ACKO5M_05100 [Vulcanococcus sp.]
MNAPPWLQNQPAAAHHTNNNRIKPQKSWLAQVQTRKITDKLHRDEMKSDTSNVQKHQQGSLLIKRREEPSKSIMQSSMAAVPSNPQLKPQAVRADAAQAPA